MTDVARILAAPLVWLAAFSAVYGLHGALCGLGVEGAGFDGRARLLLVSAFALAALAQAALLAALHAPRFASPSRFVRFVSRTTGWVGLVATLWTLFPVLGASWCVR